MHDGSVANPGYCPAKRIREFSMLGRILAVTLTIGGAMTSSAMSSSTALAQSDAGAVAAGVVTGIVVGTAVATGAVPLEQREPLRGYVYREPRPYYRYDDEVAVGRELPPGAYESYPVPEQYGVPGHHYAIINNRAVIFHPATRRIIHVYD
jgi:hypothetical protein